LEVKYPTPTLSTTFSKFPTTTHELKGLICLLKSTEIVLHSEKCFYKSFKRNCIISTGTLNLRVWC